MAEKDRSKVLRVFQSNKESVFKPQEICRLVGQGKKVVNGILYRLQREQAIEKVQEMPPLWKFKSGFGFQHHVRDGNAYVHKPGHMRSKKPTAAKVTLELTKRVIHFLKEQPGSASALDIAKGVGLQTARDINRTLYALLRKGVLVKQLERKNNKQIPQWKLKSDVDTTSQALQNMDIDENADEMIPEDEDEDESAESGMDAACSSFEAALYRPQTLAMPSTSSDTSHSAIPLPPKQLLMQQGALPLSPKEMFMHEDPGVVQCSSPVEPPKDNIPPVPSNSSADMIPPLLTSSSGLALPKQAISITSPSVTNKLKNESKGFQLPPSPMAILQSRGEYKPPNPSVSVFPFGATPNRLRAPFASQTQSDPRMKLLQGLGINQNSTNEQPNTNITSLPGTSNANLASALNSETFAALNKNPISALMEYAQSRQSTATIELIGTRGPPHLPKFEFAVVIGKRTFPSVVSRNKKDGKKEAADVALRILMGEGQFQAPSKKQTQPSLTAELTNKNTSHFDKIAALSHQAFNALAARIPESLSGRKVLAALIMQRGPDDVGSVISLGTGNRCITGEQLSMTGDTVNDSHAEIITRRGFIRFLYQHLENYGPSSSDSVFEQSASSGKLKIKDGITFHLYISTAPCGDGALFSPRDSNAALTSNDNVKEHNPTFTSAVQGVLRTKMEGGEGTIPIESDFVAQTWDGILRGERLRTMSCSDKICRWNILGMQGGLLTHFMEPVYLNSLTLGLLYDHGHLSRASCCRLARGEPDINEGLPQGYHLNHPHLGRVTVYDAPRETQKTKAVSINWCCFDQHPEVTDGTTGQLVSGRHRGISQVAKSEFYSKFKRIASKFDKKELLEASSYLEAKRMAKDFQTVKQIMVQRFKKNKFGTWVGKPVEEKMFT